MLAVNLLRKKCIKCGREKSLTLGFDRPAKYSVVTPDGYKQRCRSCSGASLRPGYSQTKPSRYAAARTAYTRNLRERVLDKFGRKCASCGFSDPRALQIDHVFNDGHLDEHMWRKARTGHFMRVLKDTEGRFQLLCANCNTIKAHEHRIAKVARRVA